VVKVVMVVAASVKTHIKASMVNSPRWCPIAMVHSALV